jgi:hypothetical protein
MEQRRISCIILARPYFVSELGTIPQEAGDRTPRVPCAVCRVPCAVCRLPSSSFLPNPLVRASVRTWLINLGVTHFLVVPKITSHPQSIHTMVLPLTPPLVSPYGTFSGSLFQYSRNLVAFESIPSSSATAIPTTTVLPKLPACKCILIGGLSDGLIPTPYTKDLEEACHSLGWGFVQPILSSSYLGFGNGSLDRDSIEIRQV